MGPYSVDPGAATLWTMRRYEALGRRGRREFLSTLAMLAGAGFPNAAAALGWPAEPLAFPILIAPASKNRVVPQGDKVAAVGAHSANAIYGIVGNAHAFIEDLTKAGEAPRWMASTLGDTSRADAQTWARRNEEAGA